jgi:multiple sugar transport system substrate-binding protein
MRAPSMRPSSTSRVTMKIGIDPAQLKSGVIKEAFMNRRMWILTIAAVSLFAGAIIWNIANRPLSSGAENKPQDMVSLSVWVFSKGWDAPLSEFQTKYPQITIDLRTFRSAEQLYKELLASISANAAPQLAEIQSFYGIPELALTGVVSAFNEQELSANAQLLPPFVEPFRYQGKLWALPIGGSVPLLYYRDEVLSRAGLSSTGFRNWLDVEKAAALPVKEGLPLTQERWRLTIDKELPWYAENIGGDPVSGRTFDLWRRWVNTVRIMPPISHLMAVSDFINGKVGVLASSSDKLTMIEQYIGGKFQFDLTRFPTSDLTGILPAVNGFVLMQSQHAKEKAAHSFVEFMVDNTAQTFIWTHMGYIPAKTDVVERLAEETTTSARQRTILDAVRSLSVRQPVENDYDRWLRVTEQLERLEQLAE